MPKTTVPRWETAVLLLSFFALWAWWLARQTRVHLAGGLADSPLPSFWNGVLLLALIALVVVFVRRMRRVQAALRENLKQPRPPFGMPPVNGHGGEQHGRARNNVRSRQQ